MVWKFETKVNISTILNGAKNFCPVFLSPSCGTNPLMNSGSPHGKAQGVKKCVQGETFASVLGCCYSSLEGHGILH